MIAAQTGVPPCPAAGAGVHQWLMRAAWACRFAGMEAGQAAALLHANMTRPPKPLGEVEAAVKKVYFGK
jgi:hypothetical protein